MHDDAAAAITVREATERDGLDIARLVAEVGMDALSPGGRAFMAERAGRVVGFIRVVEADGRPYVSPVIVDAQARHAGVGRTLMNHARSRYGALLLVARGNAVPFYEALGCERVPEASISPELGEDCDHCSDRAACGPVPMIYR